MRYFEAAGEDKNKALSVVVDWQLANQLDSSTTWKQASISSNCYRSL